MGDVICRKCGEPWDWYGIYHHEDMDVVDANRFIKGQGCPSCNFGKKLDNPPLKDLTEEHLYSIMENME